MFVQVQILSAVLLKHLNSINKNLRKNNMKTIPFDIKLRKLIQSEENHYQGRYKVQTKSGNPVRIVCWDKKDSKFPIVALVMNSAIETSLSLCKEGKYYPTGDNSNYDLLLVDTWEPMFKVGDKVRYKNSNKVYRIADILEGHYLGILPDQSGNIISFEDANCLELVPEESEQTDFEKELANCLYKSIGVVSMYGMEVLAKMFAPKLLELAKKEIIEKLKEK